MNKFILRISLVIYIFCFSCTKPKDTLSPTIELISPKENDTLSSEKSEYSIQFNSKQKMILVYQKDLSLFQTPMELS